jgi:hypothetical protein
MKNAGKKGRERTTTFSNQIFVMVPFFGFLGICFSYGASINVFLWRELWIW